MELAVTVSAGVPLKKLLLEPFMARVFTARVVVICIRHEIWNLKSFGPCRPLVASRQC